MENSIDPEVRVAQHRKYSKTEPASPTETAEFSFTLNTEIFRRYKTNVELHFPLISKIIFSKIISSTFHP